MNFLSAAGLDFPRHGAEGIDPAARPKASNSKKSLM